VAVTVTSKNGNSYQVTVNRGGGQPPPPQNQTTTFIQLAITGINAQPPVIINPNIWVLINGVRYNFTSTQLIASVPTGLVTIQTQPLINASLSVRQVFTGWSDGNSSNPRQLTVTSNMTIQAVYATQYLISVSSEYVTPTGSGWHDENSQVTVSVQSPVNGTMGTRYVFDDWTGGYPSQSNPVSFQVTQPVNMTASWRTQYFLDVDADGHGVATGTAWYNEGSSVSFGVTSLYNVDQYERYAFVSWSGIDAAGPSVQLVMNQPYSVKAQWKRQLLANVTVIGSDGLPMQVNGLRMEMDAPNGTDTINVSPGAVWMDEGVWTIKCILWHNLDVTPSDMMFKPSKYAKWVIRPKAFTLTVHVSTMLMRRGVQNDMVSVQLPDGSPYSAITNQTGYAALVNLPSSDYMVNVARDANPISSNPFHLTEDTTLQVTVQDPVEDFLAITMVLLGIVAMCVVARPSTRSRLLSQVKKRKSSGVTLESRVYGYILSHQGVISKSTAAQELGISTDTLMSVITHLKKRESPNEP
jgi:hypothetical protein